MHALLHIFYSVAVFARYIIKNLHQKKFPAIIVTFNMSCSWYVAIYFSVFKVFNEQLNVVSDLKHKEDIKQDITEEGYADSYS